MTKQKKNITDFEDVVQQVANERAEGEMLKIQKKIIQKSMSARSGLLAETDKNAKSGEAPRYKQKDVVTEGDEQTFPPEINEEYDEVVRHHHNLVYHQHKFTTHFNVHSNSNSDRRESGENFQIEPFILKQEERKTQNNLNLQEIVAEFRTLQSPSKKGSQMH